MIDQSTDLPVREGARGQRLALDLVLLFIGGSFLGITFHDHTIFRYQAPLPAMVYDQCPGELAELCKLPIQDMTPLISSMVGLVMALTGCIASLRLFGAVKVSTTPPNALACPRRSGPPLMVSRWPAWSVRGCDGPALRCDVLSGHACDIHMRCR